MKVSFLLIVYQQAGGILYKVPGSKGPNKMLDLGITFSITIIELLP